MSWIEQVPEEDAAGAIEREYAAARQRAGKVWNIVKLMSLNPAVLRGSMDLYTATMKGESPLSRAQREMIAVVVSKANNCHY
jgi:alkylhydroperoxidase family enzyme